MNNKGFTLVEMLAVVVILAVIGGIATTGVINTINTSKLKSEKIFVDKISNLIDDYLDLYRPTKEVGESYILKKCANSECSKYKDVELIEVIEADTTNINLRDLVEENIINEEDLINPKNKEKCLTETGPKIRVYKDAEYVYYYYVDLSGTNTSCDISAENGVINTFPDNISDELKQELGLSE